jgi:hypothetical protein
MDINVTVEDNKNIQTTVQNRPLNVFVNSIGLQGPAGPAGTSSTGGGIISGDYYPNNNPSGFLNSLSGLSTGLINQLSGEFDRKLYLTGSNLQTQINNISLNTGRFLYTGDILRYNTYLTSGLEGEFIQYPVLFATKPKAINCEIENNIDSFIYSTTLGSVTNSGFFIYYSDNLSATGYKLYITVGQ